MPRGRRSKTASQRNMAGHRKPSKRNCPLPKQFHVMPWYFITPCHLVLFAKLFELVRIKLCMYPTKCLEKPRWPWGTSRVGAGGFFLKAESYYAPSPRLRGDEETGKAKKITLIGVIFQGAPIGERFFLIRANQTLNKNNDRIICS